MSFAVKLLNVSPVRFPKFPFKPFTIIPLTPIIISIFMITSFTLNVSLHINSCILIHFLLPFTRRSCQLVWPHQSEYMVYIFCLSFFSRPICHNLPFSFYHYYYFLCRIFTIIPETNHFPTVHNVAGTAVAQWLRYCATNRKVAGSIPEGVIGIFH